MTTPSSSSAPTTSSSITDKPAAVAHAWEDVGTHVWEDVQEDEHGNLVLAHSDSLAQAIRKRRKRMEQNDYAQKYRRIVRDMIRYVYIVLDASRWMRDKDPILPPGTKLEATIRMLQDFVNEYFDQNPLSHLGIVVLQQGEAELVSPLSTSRKLHTLALQSVYQQSMSNKGGEFSLQNGLEVAGRSLGHQPRHGSREIVLITSALSTCDPGSLLTDTLPKLVHSRIRFSCFALTAELHICRNLAQMTHGTMGVCLDQAHFREWLMGQCVPPPTLASPSSNNSDSINHKGCDMLLMGFPTRSSSEVVSLVHATRDKTIMSRVAYVCPQCQAKNETLPTDCAVCGLSLVLSPHLARSFHHLFPVSTFLERSVVEQENEVPTGPQAASSSGAKVKPLNSDLVVSSTDDPLSCFSCLRIMGSVAAAIHGKDNKETDWLRFQCPDCDQYFCVDCDAYLHETLHNCPGCLRRN